MVKILFTISVALLLAACHKDPQQSQHHGEFKVETLFRHDGCTVYRFLDRSYVYYTKCIADTSAVHYVEQQGKTTESRTVPSQYE